MVTHTETPMRLFGITAGGGGGVTMVGPPGQEQPFRYFLLRKTLR